MRLSNEQIDNFVNELRQTPIGIEQLRFTYKPKPKDEGYKIDIDIHGPAYILHEEQHYENIFKGLHESNDLWLDSLTDMFDDLEVIIELDEEGRFIHQKIKFIYKVHIPHEKGGKIRVQDWISYINKEKMYQFAPFGKFIEKFELKVHMKQIYCIFVFFSLDATDIDKALEAPLSQTKKYSANYLSGFFKIENTRKEYFKDSVNVTWNVPVIQGRMHTEKATINFLKRFTIPNEWQGGV